MLHTPLLATHIFITNHGDRVFEERAIGVIEGMSYLTNDYAYKT